MLIGKIAQVQKGDQSKRIRLVGRKPVRSSQQDDMVVLAQLKRFEKMAVSPIAQPVTDAQIL